MCAKVGYFAGWIRYPVTANGINSIAQKYTFHFQVYILSHEFDFVMNLMGLDLAYIVGYKYTISDII